MLPNQAEFEEFFIAHLKKAEDSKELFAILFIDLEEFKKTNARFGHRFGDRLNALVGKRLSEALQQEGMGARYGGDEFVILLNDINHEQNAISHSKKIRCLKTILFKMTERFMLLLPLVSAFIQIIVSTLIN